MPALLLLFRAAAVLAVYGVMQTLTFLSPSVLVCTVLLLAYLDWFCFRLDKISKACGFLAPLALCVLANANFYSRTECGTGTLLTVVYYVNSIAWATASSYAFANQMLELKYPVHDLVVVILLCINCILHLAVHCEHETLWLVVGRMALYYPITICHWFAQVLISDYDRNRFAFTVLHAGLHLLFVDLYVVAGSIFIFCLVLLYTMHRQHSYHSAGPKSAPKSTPFDDDSTPDSMSALVSELRAAKQRASV